MSFTLTEYPDNTVPISPYGKDYVEVTSTNEVVTQATKAQLVLTVAGIFTVGRYLRIFGQTFYVIAGTAGDSGLDIEQGSSQSDQVTKLLAALKNNYLLLKTYSITKTNTYEITLVSLEFGSDYNCGCLENEVNLTFVQTNALDIKVKKAYSIVAVIMQKYFDYSTGVLSKTEKRDEWTKPSIVDVLDGLSCGNTSKAKFQIGEALKKYVNSAIPFAVTSATVFDECIMFFDLLVSERYGSPEATKKARKVENLRALDALYSYDESHKLEPYSSASIDEATLTAVEFLTAIKSKSLCCTDKTWLSYFAELDATLNPLLVTYKRLDHVCFIYLTTGEKYEYFISSTKYKNAIIVAIVAGIEQILDLTITLVNYFYAFDFGSLIETTLGAITSGMTAVTGGYSFSITAGTIHNNIKVISAGGPGGDPTAFRFNDYMNFTNLTVGAKINVYILLSLHIPAYKWVNGTTVEADFYELGGDTSFTTSTIKNIVYNETTGMTGNSHLLHIEITITNALFLNSANRYVVGIKTSKTIPATDPLYAFFYIETVKVIAAKPDIACADIQSIEHRAYEMIVADEDNLPDPADPISINNEGILEAYSENIEIIKETNCCYEKFHYQNDLGGYEILPIKSVVSGEDTIKPETFDKVEDYDYDNTQRGSKTWYTDQSIKYSALTKTFGKSEQAKYEEFLRSIDVYWEKDGVIIPIVFIGKNYKTFHKNLKLSIAFDFQCAVSLPQKIN